MFKKAAIILVLGIVFMMAEAFGAVSLSRPATRQDAMLATTLDGKAYDIIFANGIPKLTETETALPALNYFGYSMDGKFKAYVALDALDEDAPLHRCPIASDVAANTKAQLVPSGDLYVEGAATGNLVRINPENNYVIAAAWSPVDANVIAYTFSSGTDFGIALADIANHRERILRSRGVIADYLSWDESGENVQAYISEEQVGRREEVSPAISELWIPAFDITDNENISQLRGPMNLWSLPEISSASPSFEIRFENGAEIRGDNILGLSTLEASDSIATTKRAVPANWLVGISRQGVVYKTLTKSGVEIDFFSIDGKVIRLAAATAVTYKMPFPAPPFPSVTVTQVGEGYSSACQVFDHFFSNNMAYAYDIFAPLSSPYVLAAGSGTVAYAENNVNCNSYDTGGCSDYSSNCDSKGGWGNAVILQHSDNTYTKYAHMKYHSVLPGFGASVGIGCQIGAQGHTGATFSSSTSNPCGDHLHFQRQTTSARGGASSLISFSDVSNPLSCASYSTGNGGRSCVF